MIETLQLVTQFILAENRPGKTGTANTFYYRRRMRRRRFYNMNARQRHITVSDAFPPTAPV